MAKKNKEPVVSESIEWTKEQTHALHYHGTTPEGFEFMYETDRAPWDGVTRSLRLVRRISDGKIFALAIDYSPEESDCDRYLFEVHSREKTVRVWYLGPQKPGKKNKLSDLPDESVLHKAPCVW
jgi:hypothetical protein